MIWDDIERFKNLLANFPDITPNEKENLTSRFGSALSSHTINPYFSEIGHGVEKICGHFDDEYRYVIKFCFDSADVLNEINANNRMREAMGNRLFLPEYGFELSENYFPDICRYWLDEDEDDRSFIYAVIIQPRITKVCAETYTDSHTVPMVPRIKWDLPSPLMDKRTHSHPSYSDVYKTNVYNRDWLQSIIDLYGLDVFLEFSELVQREQLCDLHNRNIGYIIKDETAIPVIIDY